MADQNPPASPEPNLSNKATVRITLPPKPTAGPDGLAKKETVRIGGTKKATIRINPSAPAVPSSLGSKLPLPPKPPGALGMTPPTPPAPPSFNPPVGAAKPVPPMPPAMSRPVPPAAPVQPAIPAAPTASPAIQKPLTPKKETSRIQLPPATKTMPKATVKLSQTVPLSQAPAAAIKTASVPETESDTETDPLLTPLSIAAAVLGVIAAILSLLAFIA